MLTHRRLQLTSDLTSEDHLRQDCVMTSATENYGKQNYGGGGGMTAMSSLGVCWADAPAKLLGGPSEFSEACLINSNCGCAVASAPGRFQGPISPSLSQPRLSSCLPGYYFIRSYTRRRAGPRLPGAVCDHSLPPHPFL